MYQGHNGPLVQSCYIGAGVQRKKNMATTWRFVAFNGTTITTTNYADVKEHQAACQKLRDAETARRLAEQNGKHPTPARPVVASR